MLLNKFALQLFSVRKSFEISPEATLKKVSDLGYSGVEVAGFASLSPAHFREICDSLELEIYAMHGGEDDLKPENIQKTLSVLNEIGCSKFVCAWVPKIKSMDELFNVCKRFNSYAAIMKENGAQFLFHNHDDEMARLEGDKTVLELLIENTEKAVGYELDTGWCNFGGVDSCDIIRRYSDRIGLIHLKQLKEIGTRIITELPNGSVIDAEKIITVCHQNGIDRFIVEQDDSDDDIKSATINADYLLRR